MPSEDFPVFPVMSDKIHLRWNDFQSNVNVAFANLKEDADFADVTLACEDGKQFEAHKVILAASSSFFQNLLRKNKDRKRPLVFMRGVTSENMAAIVDFIYCGEASVAQENLESFLAIAEELQLNGLMEQMVDDRSTKKEIPVPIKLEQKEQITSLKSDYKSVQISDMRSIYRNDNIGPILDDLKEVANQVNALIERSDKMVKIGKNPDGQIMYKRALICQLCGKEGSDNNIRNHIEVNHLEGIALPCSWCKKTFKTRKSLRRHKGAHVERHSDQNSEENFKTWTNLKATPMPMMLPKKNIHLEK